MTDAERAFQDGYAENLAGVRLKDNPFVYDASPDCWLAWRDGWWRAMQERIDGERPDEPSPEEMRRMRRLYDAEKAAGLHRPRAEQEADLIDAGRGHLIRRE